MFQLKKKIMAIKLLKICFYRAAVVVIYCDGNCFYGVFVVAISNGMNVEYNIYMYVM